MSEPFYWKPKQVTKNTPFVMRSHPLWRTSLKSLLLALSLISPMAFAQIVPDPNAVPANQPQVTTGANNVPIVNITTPNGAGVSLNHYQHFNVAPQGAILNNAVQAAQALGQAVAANPNVAGGAASVIVNQVTHPNPSQLLGQIAVAGQRAYVVIANPSGITCDGCGFLNADHQGAILTTGVPILSSYGGLESFRVQQGTVTIAVDGLDATQTDYTAILAKAVLLSAKLKANALQVVSGDNTVSADGKTVKDLGGTSYSVGIDVALLGGMYANKITLIATDAGAGVRHAGETVADEISITAPRIENTGQITARQINPRDSSSGGVSIKAHTILNHRAVAMPSHVPSGITGQNIALLLHGGSDANPSVFDNLDGRVQAHDILDIQSHDYRPTLIRNTHGEWIANRMWVTATHPLSQVHNTQGLIKVNDTLRIDAARLSNSNGLFQVKEHLYLKSRDLDNRQGKLHGKHIIIDKGIATGSLINVDNREGEIRASEKLTAYPFRWNNQQGTAFAGQELRFDGKLSTPDKHYQVSPGWTEYDNTGGSVTSGGLVSISMTNVINTDGLIRANGLAQVSAQNFTNTQTDLSNNPSEALGLQSSSVLLTLHNNAIFHENGQMPYHDAIFNNRHGIVKAAGELTITHYPPPYRRHDTPLSGSQLIWNNEGGQILAGKALTINSTKKTEVANKIVLDNTRGTVSGHTTIVDVPELTLTGGTLASPKGLDLQLKTLNNTDSVVAVDGDLKLRVDTFDNTRGQLNVGGHFDLFAVKAFNVDGGIHAKQSVTVKATTVTNQRGQLTSNDAMRVTVNHFDNEEGAVTAAKTLNLASTTGMLSNRHGLIEAPDLRMTLSTVDNAGGRIYGDDTVLDANTVTNRAASPGAMIGGRRSLTIGVDTLQNTEKALLFSGGDLTIGGRLDAHGRAGGDASLVRNAGGMLDAAGKVIVNARNIQHIDGGVILAGHTVLYPTATMVSDARSRILSGAFSLETPGTFMNLGRLEARTIEIAANHVDNVGKLVRADEWLRLRGVGTNSTLDNREGVLFSQGKMAIEFDRAINTGGTMLAGQDGQLSFGDLTGDGRVVAKERLDLSVTQPFTQTENGLIDASYTALRVPSFRNRGRVYGDRTSLEAATVVNEHGGVIAARQQLDLGVVSLENRDHGWIASGGTGAIGGKLAGDGQAVGEAQSILNRGATIETEGNLQIRTASLHNENAHLETNEDTVVVPPHAYHGILPQGEQARIPDPGKEEPKESLRWDGSGQFGTGKYWILPQARDVINWREFRTVQQETETRAIQSDPARILVGGNLTLAVSGEGVNDNSEVLVGQTLNYQGKNLSTLNVKGTRWLHEHGVAWQSTHEWEGGLFGRGNWRENSNSVPYPANPTPIPLRTFPLGTGITQDHTAVAHSGQVIPAKLLQAQQMP